LLLITQLLAGEVIGQGLKGTQQQAQAGQNPAGGRA
jgi:hypothetical protein